MARWLRDIVYFLIFFFLRRMGKNKALQAGPAKTLKITKYRGVPVSFASSDLKFGHAINNRLAETLYGELKTKNVKPVDFLSIK